MLLTLRVSIGFLLLDESLEVLNLLLKGSLDCFLLLDSSIHLFFLLRESQFISVLKSFLLLFEFIHRGNLLLNCITKFLDVLFHLSAILFPFGLIITSLRQVILSLFSKVLLLVSQSVLKHGHLLGYFLDLIFLHGEFFSGLFEDLVIDSLKLQGSLIS